MHFEFITLDGIIDDWIEDNELSQDLVSKSTLKRWATDVSKDMAIVDASKHKIMLLDVTNTKARLPKDFHTVISVAYRIYDKKDKCTPVQKLVEYTQKNYGQDCDLEIRVKCNECQKTDCSCGRPTIEIDVDRIWQMQNPWYYNPSNMGLPHNIGEEYTDAAKDMSRFKVMAYSTNPYHNLKHHIPNCVNLGYKSEYRYTIDLPYIETDIMPNCGNAELLVAYYGKRLDENGDIMIPDITDAIEAVEYHLSYKWYQKQFIKNKSRELKMLSNESLQLRDLAIGRAKSRILTPSHDKFRAFASEIFTERPRTNATTHIRPTYSRHRY